MFLKLLESLIKYPKITIFKHINSDGDCVFSALGMKQFILDNFPEKEVHIVGDSPFDLFEYREKVSDEFIKGSLAVVLDTSTKNRIDDDRSNLAALIVKIDHHPVTEDYGEIAIVNDKAAATAELLTQIFSCKEFESYSLSKKTREYLYCGILTDSMNFTTTSTTSYTLKCAAKLVQDDLSVGDLNEYIFKTSLVDFVKITRLRSYLEFSGKCGYLLLDEADLDELDMTTKEAKDCVAELKDIDEFKIWAIIAYNKDTGLYDGSLRSKKGYQVNETASRYNGGGHVNAAGVKSLTREKAEMLIEELIECSLGQ